MSHGDQCGPVPGHQESNVIIHSFVPNIKCRPGRLARFPYDPVVQVPFERLGDFQPSLRTNLLAGDRNCDDRNKHARDKQGNAGSRHVCQINDFD